MFSLYGIILAVAGLIALGWWRRRMSRFGVAWSHSENLAIIGIPLVVIGARLHHVLTDWHVYADAPERVLFIWQGGLGLWGALAGGLLAIFMYARHTGVNFHTLLNSITPPVLVAMAIGRWANVANHELVPFAYIESLAAVGILTVVLIIEKKGVWTEWVWCIGLGLYSVARFFGELVRTEPRVLAGLTVNQIISLLVFIACCAVLYQLKRGGAMPHRH